MDATARPNCKLFHQKARGLPAFSPSLPHQSLVHFTPFYPLTAPSCHSQTQWLQARFPFHALLASALPLSPSFRVSLSPKSSSQVRICRVSPLDQPSSPAEEERMWIGATDKERRGIQCERYVFPSAECALPHACPTLQTACSLTNGLNICAAPRSLGCTRCSTSSGPDTVLH